VSTRFRAQAIGQFGEGGYFHIRTESQRIHHSVPPVDPADSEPEASRFDNVESVRADKENVVGPDSEFFYGKSVHIRRRLECLHSVGAEDIAKESSQPQPWRDSRAGLRLEFWPRKGGFCAFAEQGAELYCRPRNRERRYA
jgi:hypothetical protein